MDVRTQPTLSSGMPAQIAEAAALSPSSICKRYRSSYEIPSPSSSLTLPIRKRYRGTSELTEDTEDEISDSDTKGDGSEEEEEAAPEGQQQAVPVVDTAAYEPLCLGYRALRCQETPTPRLRGCATWVAHVDGTVYTDIPIDVPTGHVLQTSPSPEWSSGSLLVSPSSIAVATLIASLRLDALPPTLFEGYDRDLRELYTRLRAVRDEIFSQCYMLRSLEQEQEQEQEQERDTVTFNAIWRPVLALESWAKDVDAQRVEMWRARYDDHRLIHDLLVQNTMMQRELQEMRDRVTILEWEGSHRGQ
ncbi:hypothetical protein Tco_0937975 [Tanacetum coccineum]|uniref:Uncharacterized protein n=1 Tax=Tanacetum coccineum TaxID=301880 RepID=A0ABQ5DGF7_9ASTR